MPGPSFLECFCFLPHKSRKSIQKNCFFPSHFCCWIHPGQQQLFSVLCPGDFLTGWFFFRSFCHSSLQDSADRRNSLCSHLSCTRAAEPESCFFFRLYPCFLQQSAQNSCWPMQSVLQSVLPQQSTLQTVFNYCCPHQSPHGYWFSFWLSIFGIPALMHWTDPILRSSQSEIHFAIVFLCVLLIYNSHVLIQMHNPFTSSTQATFFSFS